jgi:NhaA family Na+:H+ antiporter
VVSTWLNDFMKQDSAGGIVLVLAALCAILIKNSSLDWLYDALLQTPVAVRVGAFEIYKPLLLWINDGLMAVFFMLIGLEVKREILEGELSSPSHIVLPAVGAMGGMAVPVLICVWLNWGDAAAIDGWAIPAATDIAFSIGVLALLGKRIPLSLRVFLLALAIFDDLGAIVVIALFYTSNLSYGSLLVASVALGILLALNLLNVTRLSAYVLVGVVLWVSVLKSGVHATLAGVALGFAIPLRTRLSGSYSPLRQLEHDLHPWVAFVIIPVVCVCQRGCLAARYIAGRSAGPRFARDCGRSVPG